MPVHFKKAKKCTFQCSSLCNHQAFQSVTMWKFLINYLLNHGLILFISFFCYSTEFNLIKDLCFYSQEGAPLSLWWIGSNSRNFVLQMKGPPNETFLLESFSTLLEYTFGVHLWSTLFEAHFRSTLFGVHFPKGARLLG